MRARKFGWACVILLLSTSLLVGNVSASWCACGEGPQLCMCAIQKAAAAPMQSCCEEVSTLACHRNPSQTAHEWDIFLPLTKTEEVAPHELLALDARDLIGRSLRKGIPASRYAHPITQALPLYLQHHSILC